MPTLPIAAPGHLPNPAGSGAWCASRSDGHRLHAGVDLVARVGTPVHAPEAATVVVVAEANRPTEPHRSVPAGWGGYGPHVVVLRGASGAFHLLGHLGTVGVVNGQAVNEGEQVGTVGQTDTPHLHWEVRARKQPIGRAAIVEVCADPTQWLAGRWVPWDGRCPAHPIDDVRTPRACRPSWQGPAPDPFPRPVPPARRGTGNARRAGEGV